jgi:carbamoyl-phosphate synthase large subunit
VKVLVTGAGALLGQGVIRALKRSTLEPHIVALDPSPLSAGLYWADSAHIIEMATSPHYLESLHDILRKEQPDIVLVGTDVELPILAEARGALERDFGTKVVVSSPEVIDIANDKWLTSRFLKEQGLDYVPSALPGDEEDLIAQVGFPLIVKPRIGARSVGLHLVRDRKELARALETPDPPVIQKHVGTADTEYTAGSLTFHGKCRASIVMRRDLRDGNTYRAYTDAYTDLNEKIRQVAERLDAFGPANFQFRLENGRPLIFEINARFSGTTPLRAHAGFNEVEMTIRHLLHGEPIIQPPATSLTILRHWSETVVPNDQLKSGSP